MFQKPPSRCLCHPKQWLPRKQFSRQRKHFCTSIRKIFEICTRCKCSRKSGDLGESDDQLLCNPPYNTCRQHGIQNSDHNVFNAMDREAFCSFMEYVLKHNAQERIIYFVSPFSFWWRRFCARTEMVEDRVREMEMFKVE